MKYQGGNKQRQWRRSFILGDSNWNLFQVGYPVATSHFAATPQSDVVRIYAHDFQRHGDAFGYDRKCPFSCIYNPQITISPTSLFSANCNGNRVKNHPQPWTCSLISLMVSQWTLSTMMFTYFSWCWPLVIRHLKSLFAACFKLSKLTALHS